MTCPHCGAAMMEHALDAQLGRTVAIDLCEPCQAFWFDGRESLALTPASTLALFRIIGEHTARAQSRGLDTATCPRCRAHLRRTHDMQRTTRFEYFRCPNGHGRLITFFDFLKEKDFIKPLTPRQVADLRKNIQMVNCSNCGAPIDLGQTSTCAHCGSPLSMLDMKQTEALVAQLREADRSGKPIDPTLPLQLERARREVEAAFRGVPADPIWFQHLSSGGIFNASLNAIARFLKGHV